MRAHPQGLVRQRRGVTHSLSLSHICICVKTWLGLASSLFLEFWITSDILSRCLAKERASCLLQVGRLGFPDDPGVIEVDFRETSPSGLLCCPPCFGISCASTNQVLAQIDLLKNLRETNASQNIVCPGSSTLKLQSFTFLPSLQSTSGSPRKRQIFLVSRLKHPSTTRTTVVELVSPWLSDGGLCERSTYITCPRSPKRISPCGRFRTSSVISFRCLRSESG